MQHRLPAIGKLRALSRGVAVSLLVLGIGTAASAGASAADWVVNINDSNFDPSPAGSTVSYAVRVSNDSVTTAPPTTLTLDISANAKFIGATGTITSCTPVPATGPTTVICSVPTLAASASVSLTANVIGTQPGVIRVSASVPTAGDTNPGNNNTSPNEATTITDGADIKLDVTGPTNAPSGSIATYTFTATNLGPSTASGLTLTIPVPTGLANIEVPAGCTLSGANYLCSIPGPLSKDGTASVDFKGQIARLPATTITVSGNIGGGTPIDPVSSNNNAQASTAVTDGSDVRVVKTASAGIYAIGEQAVFTLVASYTGNTPNGLTIIDAVPTQFRVDSVTASTGSNWSCGTAGQTVTCTKPSGGAAGASQSLGTVTIRATVLSVVPDDPTNIATIGAASPVDPVPSNDSSGVGLLLQSPVADLRANKSGPNPAIVVQDTTFNYQISTSNLTKTNPRSAPFSGTIIMTDQLQAGLDLVGVIGNGWTCKPAAPVSGPRNIECRRTYTDASPLAVGGTTPSAILQVKATAPGKLINTMTVTTETPNWPDNDLVNNAVSVAGEAVPPGLEADVKVLKSVTLSTIPWGDVQTFTIEIVNTGPSPSRDVRFSDDLKGLINSSIGATGAGFIDYTIANNTPTPFSCSTAGLVAPLVGRRLSCTIDTLPVCTAGSNCPMITVRVRPGGVGGVTQDNVASAISNLTQDPNRTNNTSAPASYFVEPVANIGITKTASVALPVVGRNVVYTLTAGVEADNRSPAEAVTVTDSLPKDVTFVSAVPSTGTCTATLLPGATTGPSDTVQCNLGTIGNGAQQTVLVTVRPNLATLGTNLVNTATVSSTTRDDKPGNETSSASGIVQAPSFDLQVNKTNSRDPIAVGDLVDFTITVKNNGPSATTNVVVTDTLPATGLSYQSSSVDDGGSCSTVPARDSLGQVLICKFPALADGEVRTVTVTMKAVGKGVIPNKVNVASDGSNSYDLKTDNNEATKNTTVSTRVDLEVVSKIATPSMVGKGEGFTYTILLHNRPGTDSVSGATLAEADNTALVDTLPSGMELTGPPTATVTQGTATQNSCTGAAGSTSFICSLGTLSNDGKVTVSVPVRVPEVNTSPQTFTNQASVLTTSTDIDRTNNAKSGEVIVTSASLSGTVFRDFNSNGQQGPGDAGVGGVVVQLTGISSGAPVTLSATTAADGTYSFPFVAPGVYQLIRGPVTLDGFSDGEAVPGGTSGVTNGVMVGATEIGNVNLTAQTAVGYYFTLVPASSRIGITKALASGPTAQATGSFEVSFLLTVNNPNVEDLANVVVTDVLQGPAPQFGTFAKAANEPGTFSITGPLTGTCGGLRADYNGATQPQAASGFILAKGESCTITIALRVMPTSPLPPLVDGGRYFNQTSVSGEGSLSGGKPTGTSERVPVAPQLPNLDITKTLEQIDDRDGNGQTTVGDVAHYSVTATNIGSMVLTGVVVSDDKITPASVTCASLVVDATCQLTGTYTITDADATAGKVVNTGTADSAETSPVTASVTTPVVALPGSTTLSKTALVSTAKRGQKVPFDITAEQVGFSPARIVDIMPPGFAYVAGSAMANGKAVEPTIAARNLTFDGLKPDSKRKITLKLTLIATSSVNPGTAVNQAQIIRPDTGAVVATARARVTIVAEAVFDCGDIIGRVFDDLNRNGYQDEGEPGLPAVRVATVRGLLVTTDPEGRFNIPCADIPDADIGSNFILKLDTRTLPTGYHLTTENPRRVRLTRGKVVKLNFGASISRLVKLDLNGKVFAPGSSTLNPKWQAGLDKLIAVLKVENSVLQIIYRGKDDALARARVHAVKDAVTQRWSAVSDHYDLAIDTRIISGGSP